MSGVSTGADGTVLVNGKPVTYGDPIDRWGQFGFRADHVGVNPTSPAPTEGSLDWSYTINDDAGWYFDSPQPVTVSGGRVFSGAGSTTIRALDENDGSEIWSKSFSYEVTGPTIAEGLAFVSVRDTGGDNLFALDVSDGSEIWTLSVPLSDDTANPTYHDGRLYHGTDEGKLYSISATDGSINWDITISDQYVVPPAVADGTIYTSVTDGTIRAYSAADGTEEWSFLTDNINDNLSAPTYHNGVVYVGDDDGGNVWAINASDGSKIWKQDTPNVETHSPTIYDDKIIVSGSSEYLQALDINTGSKLWSRNLSGEFSYSKPAIADGVVYVAFELGSIFAVNASDGSTVWNATANSNIYTSPSVVNGRVYIQDWNADVYAYE